jgi:hypothetical protein
VLMVVLHCWRDETSHESEEIFLKPAGLFPSWSVQGTTSIRLSARGWNHFLERELDEVSVLYSQRNLAAQLGIWECHDLSLLPRSKDLICDDLTCTGHW